MTLRDNIVSTAWWDTLSVREQTVIMHDRMTDVEIKRLRYMKVKPGDWWKGKNVMERSNIYDRFSTSLPPQKTKSRSYNKIKRGEKK